MRFLLLALLLLPWPALANPATTPPVVEPWVKQGWQILEERGLKAAVNRWQEGVNHLPADRILLSPVGFFSSSESALQGVHTLSIRWRGIVLKGYIHNQPKYFVLSAPSPEYVEQVRNRLKTLLPGNTQRVRGWSASRFQPGGRYTSPESTHTTPAVTVAEATAHPEVNASSDVEPWVKQGWQILAEHGLEAAVKRWREGVMHLPADQILLSPVGFFSSAESALQGVHTLGIRWHGIVLKGYFHKQPKYFVLSAPPPEQVEQVRGKLGQQLAGGVHRIYGWNAGRFQAGGSYATPENLTTEKPAPTPKTTPAEPSTIPAKKKQQLNGDSSSRPTAPAPSSLHARVQSGKTIDQRSPEQESKIIMEMALRARAEGNRKKAIGLLTEVLKRTPEHARARLMVGKLMIKDGQYDAAWQIMRPLLKKVPLDWKPWFWSGTAELMVGKLNDAAKHFDEALARNGRIAAVWVQRSLVAQQRGRYAVAYQLLKVAEAEAPKSVQVMLNLGLTLDAMGKKEAARTYYQHFLVHTSGTSDQWQARKVVIGRLEYLSPQINLRQDRRVL